MKIELWWIGKTFEPYVKSGIDDYLKRLQRFASVQVMEIPDIKGQTDGTTTKAREAAKILEKLKPEDLLILLDEKGKSYSSVEFSRFMEQKENQSVKKLVFLVGGAFGFDEKIYQRANGMVSLSKMTFSHQLIRLLFLEQLYRAYTILHNFPYHNE